MEILCILVALIDDLDAKRQFQYDETGAASTAYPDHLLHTNPESDLLSEVAEGFHQLLTRLQALYLPARILQRIFHLVGFCC